MPLGEQVCQPEAAEPAECQLEDGGAVEEGRDHWKTDNEELRRRKRNINAAGIKHIMEHEARDYPTNNSREVSPASHQLQDDQNHSALAKRQCFDGYDIPPGEQHQKGDIQADHHSTLHAEEEEDIVFVMKRQLAEANNLLAKCGEALSEGIAYEAFFPVRIDEMLRATHSLEESLLQQKQLMKDRLQDILGLL